MAAPGFRGRWLGRGPHPGFRPRHADALHWTGGAPSAGAAPGPDLDVTGFQVSDQLGTYGSLELQSNGAWAYNLSNGAANVQALVSGQQVSTLPLNGRDITNLVLLQPPGPRLWSVRQLRSPAAGL